MIEDEKKDCPENCPFLQNIDVFCSLFSHYLDKSQTVILRCEECLNQAQRKKALKIFELRGDVRTSFLRQNLAFDGSNLKVNHERDKEGLRQKLIGILDDKYGDKPPLEGNTYLKNLIVNLYMSLDTTEQNMMNTVLNGKQGISLIKKINSSPKDDSLLRNLRRELDDHFKQHQKDTQITSVKYNNFQKINR